MKNSWFVLIGCLGLIVVYLFQMQLFYDPYQNFSIAKAPEHIPALNTVHYVFSKTLRYLLNDGFALLIIWGLFGNKQYIRFAVIVLLFGLIVLLPIYLVLSIAYYPNSFTFLNHLHRVVLNPVLMMLLIPAFYYQQSLTKKAD